MRISKGTVKFFNEQKYWGFIQTEDQGDLFFHGKELMTQALPKKGDLVMFEIEEDGQGRLRAIKIDHLD